MGLISHRAPPSTGHTYDIRMTLASDKSVHSMALLLEKYSADENAEEGTWVLLEPD